MESVSAGSFDENEDDESNEDDGGVCGGVADGIVDESSDYGVTAHHHDGHWFAAMAGHYSADD